jgi:hypothetical protein
MKTLIVTIFSLAAVMQCMAGNDLYVSKMKETLQAMDKCQTLEDFQKVANTFEIIAQAEKDKWLPYYYSALTYGIMSMQATDPALKDKYGFNAQDEIKRGLEIKPDESELYVLQAFTCYALIQVNPMERGMEYMTLANQALAKAEELNNDNPRIYYLRGQAIYNMPVEYGGGSQAALPILKQAKEKYDKANTSDELFPRWGKEDIDSLLEQIAKTQ